MEIRFLIAKGPSNILLLQRFEALGTHLKVSIVVQSIDRFVTEYPLIDIACTGLRLQLLNSEK